MMEFTKIHYHLFDFESEDLQMSNQYEQAVQQLLVRENSAYPVQIEEALSNNLDLEAIEYFVRFKYGKNTLTQRFHVLTYLAESRSKYYHFFVNEKPALFKAFFLMAGLTFRSIFKVLKGAYLVKRYQLV